MKRRRIICALLALAWLLSAAASGEGTMHREVANPAFEMDVTVGYDGLTTYGKAMPVRIRIRNRGGDFEGKVGLNAYISVSEYDRYETEIALPAGSEKEYVLAPVVYARQAVYTAEITKGDEVLCAVNAEPETTVNPSAMLIGVLSTRPQNLNNLIIDRENDTLARYELWQTVALNTETFPEDPVLMKSFGMLAVDDIDPATLNTKQQKALEQWLLSGRIVLCGGGGTAGRNVPWFSGYTGLQLESLTTSDSVIAGLERFIGRAESGKQTTAALAVLSGGTPAARDAEGRGLLYRTSAGAGRIYTAAFELGDAGLNANALMHYFWQQALVDQDQELYSRLFYDANYDASSVSLDSNNVPVKARSMLLSGILIAAGALVLACALWWILKRRDRQQWMWLALPVLAVAAAGCLFLLAGGAETNKPMAVIGENLVQDGTGVIRTYSNVTAAAPTAGRHSWGMEGEKLRVLIYDYIDYNEEEEESRAEPVTLRTCYTAGGVNTVTAESKQPWGRITMTSEGSGAVEGSVDGTAWMEQDGLHCEIVNGTGLRLAPGHVITNYGYVSMPAIGPGEKAEAVLTKKQFADPLEPNYEDGGLYLDNSLSLYAVINAAAGLRYNEEYSADPEKAAFSAMVNSAAEQLRQSKGNFSYGAYESTLFLYCARPENLAEPVLTVDGTPVRQTTFAALLSTEMKYDSVGRTGVVFRSAGMDYPVRMEIDEELKPAAEMPTGGSRDYYFPLTDIPTFRFTFSDIGELRIDRLQIIMDSYYSRDAECLVLNAGTGEWEVIKVNKELANPQQYLDGEGNLYIQFRPVTTERYAEIPTPMIILEGRQAHAEN